MHYAISTTWGPTDTTRASLPFIFAASALQAGDTIMALLGLYNYFVFAVLLMIGLYCVLARTNIVKSLIGLSIFQSAVFLLYISMDKVDGGTAPIIQEGVENQVFANPLPQVLILTAIVVGISTTALALAVAVRIKEAYGTIEEDKIQEMDREP